MFLRFLLLSIIALPWRVLADAPYDCHDLKPSYTYDLPDLSSGKQSLLLVEDNEGSQNNPIFLYLKTGSKCKMVLSTWGRGMDFKKSKDGRYPDIVVYWHIGAGKNPPVAHYVWAGDGYVDAELSKSESLNKKALRHFERADIRGAIKLWEQAIALAIIPGLGYTSNTEALNNLGFAYYKLGLKSESDKYFKLARTYMEQSIEVDPRRWVAYLNLGDLFAEWDMPGEAIWHYNKLLDINPNYNRADKIREKIKSLTDKLTTE